MDKGKVFERLMLLARKKRLQVQFLPLQASYGILCNDRIGIANNMSIEQINHTLAHELAHAYLHYDKGDITENTGDYEEQAERTAKMLLDFVGA